MSKKKLEILLYPHPILTTPAEPVTEITAEIQELMDDMLEAIYREPASALAAPQVGVSKRFFVMDIDEAGEYLKPNVFFMINPEITWRSKETEVRSEGCMSFPEIRLDVKRHLEIKVKYLDREGKPQNLHAKNWMAWCIQHEVDHLDGITSIDHVSPLKRALALRKLSRASKALARKKS